MKETKTVNLKIVSDKKSVEVREVEFFNGEYRHVKDPEHSSNTLSIEHNGEWKHKDGGAYEINILYWEDMQEEKVYNYFKRQPDDFRLATKEEIESLYYEGKQ